MKFKTSLYSKEKKSLVIGEISYPHYLFGSTFCITENFRRQDMKKALLTCNVISKAILNPITYERVPLIMARDENPEAQLDHIWFRTPAHVKSDFSIASQLIFNIRQVLVSDKESSVYLTQNPKLLRRERIVLKYDGNDLSYAVGANEIVDGFMINSPKMNGLKSDEASSRVKEMLNETRG